MDNGVFILYMDSLWHSEKTGWRNVSMIYVFCVIYIKYKDLEN